MATEIFFPPVDPVWEFDRDVVRFYAVVGQRTVACAVSAEALYQFFGARSFDAAECLRAFNEHRSEIEAVARQKLETSDDPVTREVNLLMRDFRPSTTTTTSPPGRVVMTTTPEITDDTELSRAVQQTTALLEREVVRGKSHVTAHWTALSPRGKPLLRLRLTDDDTKAEAENLFTPHDLENQSAARFSLFRLWDDLLRKKGALLMEEYQKAQSGEGDR